MFVVYNWQSYNFCGDKCVITSVNSFCMYIYNNVYMQNCCTFVCENKKNASFYQKKRMIVCEIIFISYFCSRKKYLITLKQRQI